MPDRLVACFRLGSRRLDLDLSFDSSDSRYDRFCCKLAKARCQQPEKKTKEARIKRKPGGKYTLLPLEIAIRLSPSTIIIQRPSINHRRSRRTSIARKVQHPFRFPSLSSLSRHGLSALFLFCGNGSRNRLALRLRTGTGLRVARETLSFGTWCRRLCIFFGRCSALHELFNYELLVLRQVSY